MKDTVVSGSLRTTDTIYSTTAQFKTLKIPDGTSSTNYTTGTNGYIIKTNGTNIYWDSDTNTTYTFENGTNGFTVTPSGGSTQIVTVTPNITNNVTGSGTNGYLAKFDGTNTITNGPQLGSSTTTFLRNDGTWASGPKGDDALCVYLENPTVAIPCDADGLTKSSNQLAVVYYIAFRGSRRIAASSEFAGYTYTNPKQIANEEIYGFEINPATETQYGIIGLKFTAGVSPFGALQTEMLSTDIVITVEGSDMELPLQFVRVRDGEAGQSAVSANIGGGTFIIPCDAEGRMKQTTNYGIPFAAYRGSARIDASTNLANYTYSNPYSICDNVKAFEPSSSTEQHDGVLVIMLTEGVEPWNTTAGDMQIVNIALTLSDGTTMDKALAFVRVRDGAQGPTGDSYILTAADKQEIATTAAALIHKTLTVTVLTQDNVTVTGQTVTVRADDAAGEVYATAAYEGQPVSFSIPTGFQYYVSVSDTLDLHFNPTTARGVIKDTNVAVTLTYSDLKNAAGIKTALNAGMDLTDLVGEQITCTKNDSTLTWDVVDYDDTNKCITLLLHDAFGTTNMQFEPEQALMWCETGLAAGAYTFKWNSTQVYFTLTTAIPSGGQLRANNTSFWTYESQDATATLETGTVSTNTIAGAINLGKTGEGLLNHHTRVTYGSSNFAESAIYWWLNSDAATNTPRTPVTKFSRAYSYPQPGFLNGLDADFIAALDNTTWLCACNNVYECPESLGGYTNGNSQTYTVTSKIGLASEMEIFGSYGGNQDGSTIFDLYNGATATDRKKYRGTRAQSWWLRSPGWTTATHERAVLSSGSALTSYANGSCAVVPAVKISKDSPR